MTILTEKETVAEKYAKALGLKKVKAGLYENPAKTTRLTYAAGHLYTSFDIEDYTHQANKTWTEKSIPYIPEKYLFKPIIAKAKIRKACEEVLKEAVKKGEEIVIATDPDREGEVIARLILDRLKVDYNKVTRIWSLEGLNEEELKKSVLQRKSSKEFDRLAQEGLSHKNADWTFGINLTRLLTLLFNDREVYSIGRVQGAALKEIWRREEEIKNFIPRKYYECRCKMENGTFSYLLTKNEKTKEHYCERSELEKNVEKVMRSGRARIVRTVREKSETVTPLLYDLSSLCQDAFRLYGFSASRTLEMAQKLYNEEGVLSYPRTDSNVLGESDVEMAVNIYNRLMKKGVGYKGFSFEKINAANKRMFNDRKKKAHHALVPSDVYSKKDSDEWKIWDLVVRRFFMQGMKNWITEDEKCYLESQGEILLIEGKRELQKGWKELDLFRQNQMNPLPKMEEGNDLKITGYEILEKYTQPPKHYNEATLLQFMKNPKGKDENEMVIGLGTQATQGAIIKILFERKYVVNQKKNIFMTEKGIRLVEKIRQNVFMDENTDVEATFRWEKLCQENPGLFLKEIERNTVKIIENQRSEIMRTVVEKKEICKCTCGNSIFKGEKGFYCGGWKTTPCENRIAFRIMGVEFDEEKVIELFEKKELPFYEGIKQDGTKVHFSLRIDEEGKVVFTYSNEDEVFVCKCPKCSSGVFKTSKVYKCSNKECDFFAWKNTNGIEFTDGMVVSLFEKNEKIDDVTRVFKDGNTKKVSIMYDKDADTLKIL